MIDIYKVIGISKQAVAQRICRETISSKVNIKIVAIMNQVRKDHRMMGCRKMYYAVNSQTPVGRDKFEEIGFANGFKLKLKRSKFKTTWSQRVEIFPNLIAGITINNINMVWQSDIFYYMESQTVYYGICIEDVYSRKLLSLHLSESLMADENLKALKKAIKARKGTSVDDCIFHSDRGSQYISTAHKELVRGNNMKLSMCMLPQENAYVERINGIIKNDYLYVMDLPGADVQKKAKIAMWLYNNRRPHGELKMLTPTAFEQKIKKLGDNERPKLHIHNWNATLSTEYQVVNKEKSSKKESLPNT